MLPWSVMAAAVWPILADVGGELVDVAGAIEKRVIGVEMKMGKLCCHAVILWRLYGALREDKEGPNSIPCPVDDHRSPRASGRKVLES